MLKRLVSETAIYGISSILGRLINYILVPLHTGLFSPGGYGIVSIFYAWAAVLNIVYTYGMETSYFRHINKEATDSQKIFRAALTSLIITALFFSGLIIAGAVPIADFLGFAGSERYVVWFALLIAADNIAVIPFAKLRHEKKAVQFASIRIVNILLNVALNYFFLYICPAIHAGEYLTGLQPFVNSFYEPDLGLGYAFLANLIASLLLLPMLAPFCLNFRFSLDLTVLRPMYKYAYPLIFSGLFYAVNEVMDRILLERWLPEGFYPDVDGTGAVGIYAACYKLSIFISLAVQAYKYAAEPFFFSQVDNRKSPQLLSKSMTYFVIALAIMFIGVSVNIDWLGHLFIRQTAYHAGLGVVPILLMANVFLGIYYNLAFWFKLTDKTYYGAFISGGGALITLTANLLLIPYWGYYGSAAATLLCYGSMAIISYLLGRRHLAVPYQVGKIAFYLLSATVLVIISFQLPLEGFSKILANNSLLLLYLAMVFFIEKRERLRV